MKWQFYALFAALVLYVSGCTLEPVSNELSWYSKYSFPIINESFLIGELLKGLVSDTNLFVEDPDTGEFSIGDTFVLNINTSDIKSYDSEIIDLNMIDFEYEFSDISLSDLPLLKEFVIDSFIKAVGDTGDVFIDGEISMGDFDFVELVGEGEEVSVKIINLLDSLELEGLEILFFSDDDTAFLIKTDSLIGFGDSLELVSSINNSIVLSGDLKYQIKTKALNALKGVLDTGGISISIDLNGLSLKDAKIKDVYIDYSFVQTLDIPVTVDGFSLHYVDMANLHMPLKVRNPFPFKLKSEIELLSGVNLDSADYYNLTTFKDLKNCDIDFQSLDIEIEANSAGSNFKESFFEVDLKDVRLFSEWNDLLGISYVPVKVKGEITSTGADIEVSDGMIASINIENGKSEITEIKGVYERESYVEGKETDFEMPLDNLDDLLDVIRDNVKLADNNLDVNLEFLMKDSSLLSDVKYWCIMMMYRGADIVADTLSWEMTDIVGGVLNSYNFEVNNMVNSFPDSIKYRIDYLFPEGAVIHLMDSMFCNEGGKSSVDMNVQFNLLLKSSLVWQIDSAMVLDLGIVKAPLEFDKGSVALLSDKVFTTQFEIKNETNFSGQIYGLGVQGMHKSLLDSLTMDSVLNNVESFSANANYLPLLGVDGISLPERGVVVSDSIVFIGNSIEELVESDSMFMRFGVVITPSSLDALLDTDFISLSASIAVEGVHSTDDLD